MNFSIIKYAIILFFLIGFQGAYAEIPRQTYGEYKSDYWQFWFLYEKESRPGQSEVTFRPFFSSYHEKYMDFKYSTFLYPVYVKQKTNYWHYWSFLHFFSGTSISHPDSGKDDDIITPLVLLGKGETMRDSYFGLFPFFGKIKSKIGLSEINFFLFNFYVSWHYKDYKARSILWPLTLYASSPTRMEHRILPFYSVKKHFGKYERYSILWPFFQWGHDFMDKKEPVKYLLIFPFYGLKKSAYGNMKSHSFLWLPLIGSFIGYGYDKRTGEKSFNALFFIYQYGASMAKDYKKHMFFPFIGYYRYASKETFFLTPLYFSMKTNTQHIKSTARYLVPFFWQIKTYYVKEERTDSYYKLWPIFKYHKTPEGEVSWNILSPFPLRGTTAEKIWDPVFSIVEYQKLANGEKRLSFLMRLYTQRWTKDEFHIYIPLILDLSLTPEVTKFKILYGLIGYEKTKKGRKLQLLWFIKI